MGNSTSKRDRLETLSSPFEPANQLAFEMQLRSYLDETGLESPRRSPNQEDELCPEFSSDALPIVFRWTQGGRNVDLVGSFNNWSKRIPLNKSTDDFVAIVDLPEGYHEYKFYVDGEWKNDPNAPTVSNVHGTLNNVVEVKKSDFDVFQALELDNKDQLSSSPPGEYGQNIPSRHVFDLGIPNAPPSLPPQLLQVILNKDISVQCEPSLLPEPNHVMLNHLYALSIKDGVMVLSATHRFQHKYVTTLLYKPI
ncbi:5'-AMP-activated protein kinase subunit beta-2-like [Convolutriloba macropyga]|uniref:5'-AMP-activated protein kinase subunit beta-2-like n=1 Tax=Convolutriloba macropyga TaxID=536237 RepID=UPI003F51DCB9